MAMDMASAKTLQQLAQQARRKTDLPALAEKTLALQTADKFRLAAMLLDAGIPDLAETIGTRACQEIQLANLFARSKR